MTGATGAKDADVSVSLHNYLFDPGTVKVGGGDDRAGARHVPADLPIPRIPRHDGHAEGLR
jgi:hypothetical protein